MINVLKVLGFGDFNGWGGFWGEGRGFVELEMKGCEKRGIIRMSVCK